MSGQPPKLWSDRWDHYTDDSMSVICSEPRSRWYRSPLLGPDGEPIWHYEPKNPCGFDLSPRHNRNQERDTYA